MKRYLHLAKYTPAGMKAAMAESMTARRAMYEKLLNAAGGTLISWELACDGDWDLVVLDEFPDSMDHAAAARFGATLKAGGALEELRSFRLATAEDFDAAASEADTVYHPPTASS